MGASQVCTDDDVMKGNFFGNGYTTIASVTHEEEALHSELRPFT